MCATVGDLVGIECGKLREGEEKGSDGGHIAKILDTVDHSLQEIKGLNDFFVGGKTIVSSTLINAIHNQHYLG